jgi:rubredoxin
VVDANPCNALTPETIYRMRSSVVQIESPNGRKGAGLLISDRFILTSGDLVDKNNNTYKIKTVRNDEMSARAVRINPSKNTALMMLDKSTEYTPLALNLRYPEVGHNGYMTLGMLDVKDFKDGEDYLENSARVEGYHYTTDRGAEILVNTFIQNVTVGGALFNKECMVSGMAHSGIRTNDGLDLFIPTETALRSLGINICGHEYVEESPWQQTVYKPVTQQIKQVQKAPEAMAPKDRK